MSEDEEQVSEETIKMINKLHERVTSLKVVGEGVSGNLKSGFEVLIQPQTPAQ